MGILGYGYKYLKSMTSKEGRKKVELLKNMGKKQKELGIDKFNKMGGDKLTRDILKVDTTKTRPGNKRGGRIGFKKGSGRTGVPAIDIKSAPTKKLSEKQKKIASLAGNPKKIDKPDFKVLQSRRKNKKII
jgi:hypothetical protein